MNLQPDPHLPWEVVKVVVDLALMRTRKQASEYFAALNPSKALLLALGRHLHVAVGSGDNKATIQQQIIDATAGIREDYAAINSPRWRR